MSRAVFAASLLLVIACAGDPSAPADGETGTGAPADTGASGSVAVSEGEGTAPTSEGETTAEPTGPTFHGDVLPLFAQHCQGCHEPGGIAPFDITDYAVAAPLSPAIAAATSARTMPPFVADNSGACRSFTHARWISDEEIDLLAAWDAAGAPEGDPTTPRPIPPAPDALVGDEIVTVTTPAGYEPVADEAGMADDYQCFVVDPGVADVARYLVGYEVVPGNPAVTHHLIGFLVDPEASTPLGGTNRTRMEALDAESPDQPGWDCYGAAGDGVLPEGTPVTWAPGGGAFNFPVGTGIRVDPGYVLVLQMHYNLAVGGGADATDLRLSMADEVEREAVNALNDRFLATLFNGTTVKIPAGESEFQWTWSERIGDWDDRISGWNGVQLLGMLPHMHGLGRRMEVELIQGDQRSCAIYVDRWDFNWQQAFMYAEPINVMPGDELQVTCEWDASARDRDTYPGLGTGDEMCLLGIYAAELP